MKRCARCNSLFPADKKFCSADGSALENDALAATLQTALGDKYALTSLIGRGSMGAVYRARHRELDDVAIKVLINRSAAQKQLSERFLREARALRKLRHPNAVLVYDLERQPELSYIVMELVDGGSLREELKRRQTLPLEEVIAIAESVCSALEEAHSHGIIHRDIKPDNILIAREVTVTGRVIKRVKIADFGIVRMRPTGDDGEGLLITRSGTPLGTPFYMSPEQWLGEGGTLGDLDGRTDIYALGCTLYELLAGRVPFRGETTPEMRRLHLNAVPTPLDEIAPRVPLPVSRVIMQAMAKERSLRAPSVGDFSRMLREAYNDSYRETAALSAERLLAAKEAWGQMSTTYERDSTQMYPTMSDGTFSQAAELGKGLPLVEAHEAAESHADSLQPDASSAVELEDSQDNIAAPQLSAGGEIPPPSASAESRVVSAPPGNAANFASLIYAADEVVKNEAGNGANTSPDEIDESPAAQNKDDGIAFDARDFVKTRLLNLPQTKSLSALLDETPRAAARVDAPSVGGDDDILHASMISSLSEAVNAAPDMPSDDAAPVAAEASSSVKADAADASSVAQEETQAQSHAVAVIAETDVPSAIGSAGDEPEKMSAGEAGGALSSATLTDLETSTSGAQSFSEPPAPSSETPAASGGEAGQTPPGGSEMRDEAQPSGNAPEVEPAAPDAAVLQPPVQEDARVTDERAARATEEEPPFDPNITQNVKGGSGTGALPFMQTQMTRLPHETTQLPDLSQTMQSLGISSPNMPVPDASATAEARAPEQVTMQGRVALTAQENLSAADFMTKYGERDMPPEARAENAGTLNDADHVTADVSLRESAAHSIGATTGMMSAAERDELLRGIRDQQSSVADDDERTAEAKLRPADPGTTEHRAQSFASPFAVTGESDISQSGSVGAGENLQTAPADEPPLSSPAASEPSAEHLIFAPFDETSLPASSLPVTSLPADEPLPDKTISDDSPLTFDPQNGAWQESVAGQPSIDEEKNAPPATQQPLPPLMTEPLPSGAIAAPENNAPTTEVLPPVPPSRAPENRDDEVISLRRLQDVTTHKEFFHLTPPRPTEISAPLPLTGTPPTPPVPPLQVAAPVAPQQSSVPQPIGDLPQFKVRPSPVPPSAAPPAAAASKGKSQALLIALIGLLVLVFGAVTLILGYLVYAYWFNGGQPDTFHARQQPTQPQTPPVANGDARRNPKLAPPPAGFSVGTLQLAAPTGSTVFIDDEPIEGTVENNRLMLPLVAGTRQVRVVTNEGAMWTQDVSVRSNQITSAVAAPADLPAPQSGLAADARYATAYAAYAGGDFQRAEIEYKKLTEEYAGDAIAHANLGYALARQRRYSEALVAFENAAELEPQHLAHWRALSWLYALKRDDATAEKALRHALELAPNDNDLRDALARLLARNERRLDEALETNATTLAERERAEYLDTKAMILLERGAVNDALATATRANEIARRRSPAINVTYAVMLESAQRFDEATETYRQARAAARNAGDEWGDAKTLERTRGYTKTYVTALNKLITRTDS